MAARKVKLQDTGEIVGKDTAGIYQAPNKKYYSSEDVYLAIDLDNKYREKCIEKMYDVMGYAKEQKISTFFFKRLAEWREGYSYSVIDKAMELSANSIEYACRTKSFNNENAKVNYIMAIIQNNLNDAQKLETHLKQKIKQKVKDENLDSMIDGIELLSTIKASSPRKSDVSSLVGDLSG